MLKRIKTNIKNYRKLKYQKILFSKNNINLRKNAIESICKIKTKDNDKINCESCDFFLKNLNHRNFIIFYKKFNSNIQLKAKYDIHSYKKKTNKNACFKSYIIFSNFMMINKKINNIQKLNTLLKINDLLILIFRKTKHSYLINEFKKNIQNENKLLNMYL